MTPDEKKRKFEEDIVEIAVVEYYAYVDEHSRTRKETDAKMFYDAMRLGVIRGINFATNQYMQSLKNFEEKKNEAEHKHQDKTE
jgi:hypothetical protein